MNQERLYKYIKEQDAIVHVCGTHIMGEGIRKTLIEILKLGEPNPEAYLDMMEKTGRYAAELWG